MYSYNYNDVSQDIDTEIGAPHRSTENSGIIYYILSYVLNAQSMWVQKEAVQEKE